MAIEIHMSCKGVVKNFPVLSDSVTTSMELFAVEGVPVDMLIEMSTLEGLCATLDFGGQFAESKTGKE